MHKEKIYITGVNNCKNSFQKIFFLHVNGGLLSEHLYFLLQRVVVALLVPQRVVVHLTRGRRRWHDRVRGERPLLAPLAAAKHLPGMGVAQGCFAAFEEEVVGVLHNHVVVQHVGGCGAALGRETGVAELGVGGLPLVLGQSGRLLLLVSSLGWSG